MRERAARGGGVVFVSVCDSTLYGLIWPLLQMWL